MVGYSETENQIRSWRKIAISLIGAEKGEPEAQTCANASYDSDGSRQRGKVRSCVIEHASDGCRFCRSSPFLLCGSWAHQQYNDAVVVGDAQ